eukprot:PhM_4_TR9810/c0_g1_i12/m.21866
MAYRSLQNNNVEQAVKDLCIKSHPTVRVKKTEALLGAVKNLSAATITRSWEMCGILRALFEEVPKGTINSDEFLHLTPDSTVAQSYVEALWNDTVRQSAKEKAIVPVTVP